MRGLSETLAPSVSYVFRFAVHLPVVHNRRDTAVSNLISRRTGNGDQTSKDRAAP